MYSSPVTISPELDEIEVYAQILSQLHPMLATLLRARKYYTDREDSATLLM